MEQFLLEHLDEILEIVLAILGLAGVSAGTVAKINHYSEDLALPIVLGILDKHVTGAIKDGADMVEVVADELIATAAKELQAIAPKLPVKSINRAVTNVVKREAQGQPHRVKTAISAIAAAKKVGVGASIIGDHVSLGGNAKLNPMTGAVDWGARLQVLL